MPGFLKNSSTGSRAKRSDDKMPPPMPTIGAAPTIEKQQNNNDKNFHTPPLPPNEIKNGKNAAISTTIAMPSITRASLLLD